MYSTKFTVINKSLHYNGDNSYRFLNGKEIINFKAKDSEIVSYPLCLGNVSKDFFPLNTTHTGLYGYIYIYMTCADYNAITNDKINDIHKYLLEKNNIK